MPLSEIKPNACFVGNSVTIVPSKGATTLPSVGSITTPFPKAPFAKAGSSAFFKDNTRPLTGLVIFSFLIVVLSIITSSSSTVLSFQKKNVRPKPTTAAMAIAIKD